MAKKKGKINWVKILSVVAFLFIILEFFLTTSFTWFGLTFTGLEVGVLLISIIVLIKAFGK